MLLMLVSNSFLISKGDFFFAGDFCSQHSLTLGDLTGPFGAVMSKLLILPLQLDIIKRNDNLSPNVTGPC